MVGSVKGMCRECTLCWMGIVNGYAVPSLRFARKESKRGANDCSDSEVKGTQSR
jgi:hypothetical protein